jgi:hypothetical protein
VLGRSRDRDRGRGFGADGANLLQQATAYLNGVAPFHYADFISNRMLYAGVDVGTVAGGTGYSFTRASEGYYTNADGTLTLFGSGALRRGERGVLIEGARTNLLLYSQDYSDANWSKTGTSVSVNTTVAPDGTTTADTLTTSGSDIVSQAVTVSSGATATFFHIVKRGNHDWIRLTLLSGGNDVRAWFNIATGVKGTLGVGGTGVSVSSGMVPLANGFYLCWVTGNVPAATSYACIIATASADNSFTRVNGTRHAWGSQAEQASFYSSYIPTTTTSVLRAADVLTYTAGVSYPLTLWAEFERAVDTGGAERITQIDAGNNNDRVVLSVTAGDLLEGFMSTGGASQGAVSVAGSIGGNSVQKAVCRFDTNSIRAARAGTLSSEDTLATLPATPTTWRVGQDATGLPLFGYIRRAAVINSAQNDASLQAMTT